VNGEPKPPENVRAVMPGGEEIPLECRYAGWRDGREDWEERGPMLAAGSGWISSQPPSEPGCEHYFLFAEVRG
jgi:hypothetical protein